MSDRQRAGILPLFDGQAVQNQQATTLKGFKLPTGKQDRRFVQDAH